MQRSAVERAVHLAGLELPEGLDFEMVGEDPILRSPHYLGNGAVVARLLTGVGAAELWRVRTGERQSLSVEIAERATRPRRTTALCPSAAPVPSPRGPLIRPAVGTEPCEPLD